MLLFKRFLPRSAPAFVFCYVILSKKFEMQLPVLQILAFCFNCCCVEAGQREIYSEGWIAPQVFHWA